MYLLGSSFKQKIDYFATWSFIVASEDGFSFFGTDSDKLKANLLLSM